MLISKQFLKLHAFFRNFEKTKKIVFSLQILILLGISAIMLYPSESVFAQLSRSGGNNNRPNAQKSGTSSPVARPSGIGLPSSVRQPLKTQANPGKTGSGLPSAIQRPGTGTVSAQKPAETAAPTTCLLRTSRDVNSADLVEIVLEAQGRTNYTISEDVKNEDLEMVAGFRYEERTLALSPEVLGKNGSYIRTLRQYEQAGMKMNQGGRQSRPVLDSSKKFVISDYKNGNLSCFSTGGPFKNDQFTLLDELPCSTALLDAFLPDKVVRLGDDWTVADSMIPSLFLLDGFQTNTLKCVLSAIVDDIAEVEIFTETPASTSASGIDQSSDIEGSYLGAFIRMDVSGKYHFDLKTGRITWFGLIINEKRSESLIGPGLDCKASLRIKIAPMTAPARLTDEVVGKLDLTPTPLTMKLVYNGQKGPWRFTHNRSWYMIEDTDKSAALCMVVQGEGVAQCNFLLNEKADPNRLISLADFKTSIQTTLDKDFGKFVHAEERMNEVGYTEYTVVVDGSVQGINMRFIYFLLTDKDGNQVTVLFEINADQLDKYDNSELEIIRSFRMIAPQGNQPILLSDPASTSNQASDQSKEK